MGELMVHESREEGISDYFQYNIFCHCIRHFPCFKFVGIKWFWCCTFEVADYTFRGCAIEDMSAVNFPVLIFSREFREFEDHFT